MAVHRRSLALLAVSPLLVPLVSATTASAEARAASSSRRQIRYTQWTGAAAFGSGSSDGVRIDAASGRLVFQRSVGTRHYDDRVYDTATWTSPWVKPGFAFTELISSWHADTPQDSWIEIRVRGRNAAHRTSSWDVLGRWCDGDGFLRRTSVPNQDNDLARVDVDTWKVASGLVSYQLSVTLLRQHGTKALPSVQTLGAVASRLPDSVGAVSETGPGANKELAVPHYSQMIHQGEYPKWNGGGEAWCSPTSTSMVLGYYHALPKAQAYGWVDPDYPDPWVDHAVRRVFDYDYDGAGNWPFNTAYGASKAGHGFVTRLRSLREAEQFIAAGIPLVAAISFGSGELDGAPINSTAGHLVVIVGFTDQGDPVINDPAASSNSRVRHVYRRAQFESAWLGGSGGTVYVIRNDAHPLPAGGQGNW